MAYFKKQQTGTCLIKRKKIDDLFPLLFNLKLL